MTFASDEVETDGFEKSLLFALLPDRKILLALSIIFPTLLKK